ncbi:DUF3299 domain-containing protein [uncultured Paraglaciecola sp.]|uniref:DUF3299 domain-containing protein n=1 Tax=uncultured Paraglaciecola sp. TaxID=1765024 RepID=UPI0030DB70AC
MAKLYQKVSPAIYTLWNAERVLYTTPDTSLLKTFSTRSISPLGWAALIPEAEKNVLAHYQTTENDFSKQLALSLQASSDPAYKSALYSTDIVDTVLEQAVSISGFIVPIDLNADRSVKSFFLVPYFGACIHYPPPPPNQMIFVQLRDGFKNIELHKAFTLSGILSQGLFEDPLGTSAYQLSLVNIKPYQGQPDDLRQH